MTCVTLARRITNNNTVCLAQLLRMLWAGSTPAVPQTLIARLPSCGNGLSGAQGVRGQAMNRTYNAGISFSTSTLPAMRYLYDGTVVWKWLEGRHFSSRVDGTQLHSQFQLRLPCLHRL